MQVIVPSRVLRLQVRACSTGVRNPMPYDSVGLQYCKLDTRQPGNYTISFHLLWPSLDEIVVYRQVSNQTHSPSATRYSHNTYVEHPNFACACVSKTHHAKEPGQRRFSLPRCAGAWWCRTFA